MANYDAAQFVGHGTSEVDGSYDPGATANGYQEHLIAEVITDKSVALCRAKGLNIHRDEQNYKDNDLKGNTYKYHCAQSIHINAGGGKRAEVFAPNAEPELAAEFYLLSELAKLGLTNGGVKSRDYATGRTFQRTQGVKLPYSDYYGEIATAWKQKVSLSIIELGFIDSSDLQIILNNTEKIATILANSMLMNCKLPLYPVGDTVVDVPKPTPPPVGSAKKYLNLHPHVQSWRVYGMAVKPVVGNECAKLAPSQYGGLSYEILEDRGNVKIIGTQMFGNVQIYAPADDDSSITTKPIY